MTRSRIGRLRFHAALFAVTLLIALPGAASATEVVHWSFDIGETVPDFVECDGFHIDAVTAGDVHVTAFLDASGDPFKFLVRTNLTDIATNDVTGKEIVNRGVFNEVFVRIDGTEDFTQSLVGFRFMATGQGEGLLLQDVGRIVYSPNEESILFVAGQHHVNDQDIQFFCALLA
jgi:hypothetical protein